MDNLFAIFINERRYFRNSSEKNLKFYSKTYYYFNQAGTFQVLSKQSFQNAVTTFRERNLMIEYTIYCDFCGEMIDIQSGSARQARRKAKAKGLLIRILRKDYCPKCAEKFQSEGIIDSLPIKKRTGSKLDNI